MQVVNICRLILVPSCHVVGEHQRMVAVRHVMVVTRRKSRVNSDILRRINDENELRMIIDRKKYLCK